MEKSFRWTGTSTQAADPDWFIEACEAGKITFKDIKNASKTIMTIEGKKTVVAKLGDWIIREDDGELSKMSHATYIKRNN